MNVDHQSILKTLGDPKWEWVAWGLLEGRTGPQLEVQISDILEVEVSAPEVSITRMNLVGTLRAWGYIVSGGRGGGDVYKVTGWAEKESKPDVSQWVGQSREVYDWVHRTFFPLTEEFWSASRAWLSLRPSDELLHENCWLYPWAYEGARKQGWFVREGANAAIVFQKFTNYPQFRIFVLYARPRWVLDLAETIAPASLRPVSIINISPRLRDAYNELHRGSWLEREEAIYDVKEIANNPDSFLNKRALETLKARCKDTAWHDADVSRADQIAVIQTWKQLNERKHRQLAISRDFIAVEANYPLKLTFGAYREEHPVAHHLFDPLANNSEVVALINEKSLNYSKFLDGTPVPGGKYGVSDFNQVAACQTLLEKGFKYIQSGGIDGGGEGLPAKKRKYACSTTSSYTFYTTFPISEYAHG